MGSFDDSEGLVSRKHPDTSFDAATLVYPRSGTQRRRVYDEIRKSGESGACDIEVQDSLGMEGNSVRPRRVELVRDGLVRDSGRRRSFKGRNCVVWVAVNHMSLVQAG